MRLIRVRLWLTMAAKPVQPAAQYKKAPPVSGPFDFRLQQRSCHLRYCNAVIVIDGAGSGRIVPVPGIVIAVFRRSLQLCFGNAGTIAAQIGVVLQRLPGQGIMVIADPEKAAEAKHGVWASAALVSDHDARDRSDFG